MWTFFHTDLLFVLPSWIVTIVLIYQVHTLTSARYT